jgi:hypothetical protein
MITAAKYETTTNAPAEGENLEVSASISNSAGHTSLSSSDSAVVDTIFGTSPENGAPSLGKLEITNITDDSTGGNYETVTMHGTGAIAGDTIKLYLNEGKNIDDASDDGSRTPARNADGEVTTTVNADGTWSIDISNITQTPVNDNEFFFVDETDAQGNIIATSDVHYWHGNYANMNTEEQDDYVLSGDGNDSVNSFVDDENDYVMVDGGAGNDTITFDGVRADYTITPSDDNTIVVEINGDVNELRNMEKINFSDGTYDIQSATFTSNVAQNNIDIDGDSNSLILGVDGNDVITVGGNVNSDGINSGDGDDTITVGGDINGKGINAGDGDDTITVGGNINSKGINAGDGNDIITVGGNINSDGINAGDGDDIISVEGTVNGKGINAGDGDDIVSVEGELYAKVDGGDGRDVVYVDMSKDEYEQNSRQSDKIKNFETIIFNDDSIIGDETLVPDADFLATLIDGVVEGVAYNTSSGNNGFTDENGIYTFRDGDTITFSVGGVVLGSVTSQEAMSGQTFLQDIANVERTDLNDEYLENIATFLQSIDSDLGDNILITPQIRESLADANIDLRVASEAEVKNLVESINKEYVNEEDAMEHVQDMLEEYAGIDESEFDEHIDDSLISATLAISVPDGVVYTTSSGLSGEIAYDGKFVYDENDDITFSDANGEVIATINASEIGADATITFEELVVLGTSLPEVSQEEISAMPEDIVDVEETTELDEELSDTQEATDIVDVDEIQQDEDIEETGEVLEETGEVLEEESILMDEFSLIEDETEVDMSALEEPVVSQELVELPDGEEDIEIHIDEVVEVDDDTNAIKIENDEISSSDTNTQESESEWNLGDFSTQTDTTTGGQVYEEVPSSVTDETVVVEVNTEIEIAQS